MSTADPFYDDDDDEIPENPDVDEDEAAVDEVEDDTPEVSA